MTSQERERIIEAILGSHSGIYSAEVCQLCGQVAASTGMAGEMGSHLSGEYVAPRHGHGDPNELLQASDRRFCEVCLTSVVRSDAHRVGQHWWLCDVCFADAKNRDEDAAWPLKDFVRRRYIERKSDAELLAWAKVAGVLDVG